MESVWSRTHWLQTWGEPSKRCPLPELPHYQCLATRAWRAEVHVTHQEPECVQLLCHSTGMYMYINATVQLRMLSGYLVVCPEVLCSEKKTIDGTLATCMYSVHSHASNMSHTYYYMYMHVLHVQSLEYLTWNEPLYFCSPNCYRPWLLLHWPLATTTQGCSRE